MVTRITFIAFGLVAIAVQCGEQASAKAPPREFTAIARGLDREVDAGLAEAKIPASPICSDAEFLRRAYIDIIGRIPSPEKVRVFLASKNPNRRAKLIDELVACPEFGRHFGSIWYDLLVKQIDHRVGPEVFENWLADQFNKNRPWDAIVREILTAEGKLDANPPTVVWFAHAEAAKAKPNDLLGTFTQKFLGQRLQCAECHNHPFTGFKQDDFWSAAALVSRISFLDAEKKAIRKDRAIPAVKNSPPGNLTIGIPETNRIVKAKFPDASPLPGGTRDPRAALASWLATAKNPSFAPAMANRIWGHFLGRGFVNPVDDFRSDNPPSHPEALKILSDEFASARFDLKHLIRCVCATNAYQRSSDPIPGNGTDDSLFSHAVVRPMTPGVMFHSVNMALGKDGSRKAIPVKHTNKDRNPETMFSRRFKGDDDEEPELAEYAHGVPQVLWLLNGGPFDGGSTVPTATKLSSPEKVVEHLYLSSLGRFPTPAETVRIKAFVAREKDQAKGYSQAYWAILNSSEFLFNH